MINHKLMAINVGPGTIEVYLHATPLTVAYLKKQMVSHHIFVKKPFAIWILDQT